MSNTQNPQNNKHIFTNQTNLSKNQQTHRDVRQDKERFSIARRASQQPAPLEKLMRPQTVNTNTPQVQNRPVPKRKTVHLTLWVNPIVKAELQRIAEKEGLSVSAVGGAFLGKALQQHIDMQYGALLEPILRQEIRKQMQVYSKRIALLLVRVAFSTEQTRNISTNILARQPGVLGKPDILDHILDSSAEAAKNKITAKTPQLESILTEVEQWFTQNGDDEEENAAN